MKKLAVTAGLGVLAAVVAIATHAFAAEKSYKAYWVCSQHPGGGRCQHYQSYDEAKKGADEHKKSTGHTDCSASSGVCPLD